MPVRHLEGTMRGRLRWPVGRTVGPVKVNAAAQVHRLDDLIGAGESRDRRRQATHYHSGLGLHTSASVHYGTAEKIRADRAGALTAAYARNPERFTPNHLNCRPSQGSTHPASRPRYRTTDNSVSKILTGSATPRSHAGGRHPAVSRWYETADTVLA
jgi:hypothetical protein